MHKLIYDFVPVELITSFIVYLSFREQLEEIVKMMMVPEFKLLTRTGRERERERIGSPYQENYNTFSDHFTYRQLDLERDVCVDGRKEGRRNHLNSISLFILNEEKQDFRISTT